MRSTVHATFAAPLLLGSTLVYAAYIHPDKRQDNDGWGQLGVVTGTIPLTTIRSNPNANVNPTTPPSNPDPTPLPNAAVAATVSSQSNDSPTDHSTNSDTVHTTSGTLSNFSIFTRSGASSTPSIPTSLAPLPGVSQATGIQNRGVLVGVVVGGVVFGCLALTVGLWLCYRRRGPTSGASTPKYTTPVTGDEKSRSPFAFMRKGGNLPWKKGHVRVKSSMSFASPVIGDEPKMIETPSTTSRGPLVPQQGGGGGTSHGRDTWNGRWSTFSTSDGSAYPQTPVNNTLPLSGVLMETVVESDAPSTPRAAPGPLRTNTEYLQLQRSSDDSMFAIPPAKDQSPHLPPLGATRYSTYREEDLESPGTPTSSAGLVFGSIGHGGAAHLQRMSDRTVTSQPYNSGLYSTTNASYQGNHSAVLLATRPKFNPIHHNGSGTVSTRQGSTGSGSGSGGDGATIRITNPFLDDDDDLSSYGHGLVEASSDADDSRSIQSLESGEFGAYPSSAGCMPLPSNSKHGALSPSPTPDADRSSTSSGTASAPMTRPRSSLISDASSDYPFPLGYAVDSEGNVANPFLRISELLEEVDGRMRWPSPPLLTRAESRNL